MRSTVDGEGLRALTRDEWRVINGFPQQRTTSITTPGRTSTGTMEDPRSPTIVAPLPRSCPFPRSRLPIIGAVMPRSCLQSRPGPMCSSGGGVFQPATAGTYTCCSERPFSSLDCCSNFSPTSSPSPHDGRSCGESANDMPSCCSSSISRPGPACNFGNEVLQTATSGNLHESARQSNTPSRNVPGFIEARICPTLLPGSTIDYPGTLDPPVTNICPTLLPGSTIDYPGTLDPPVTNEIVENSACCSYGSVCRVGERVPAQISPTGKYTCFKSPSRIDALLASSSSEPDSAPRHPPHVHAAASLSIYYQNVRGLRTKTSELLVNMDASVYDVVVLTETWLRDDIRDTELSGVYNIYRCDRSVSTSNLSRGGGVLIAVKPELSCRSVTVEDADSLEQKIIRINLQSKTLFICSIYVRPQSSTEVYAQHVSSVQRIIEQAKPTDIVVVLGDYNLPNLTWELDEELNGHIPTNATTEQELTLTESLLAAGLLQMNSLRNANSRVLDLAFVSDADLFVLFEPPSPLLQIDPHHIPFALKLDYEAIVNSPTPDTTEYDFKRCDYHVLNRAISSVDWNQLAQEESIDIAVDRFYATLETIFAAYVPKKASRKDPEWKLPWWSKNLRKLKNRLRKANNVYTLSQNPDDKRFAQSIEIEYRNLLQDRFRGYIRDVQNDLRQNPANFWSFVKKRKNRGGLPIDISYDGTTSTTAAGSADLFADFFRSVYSDCDTQYSQAYVASLPTYDIHLPPFALSAAEVFRSLESIDASKGPGPDGIPPMFIKSCSLSLAHPVSIIYNRSLTEGVFPERWKVASIVPIHKSGSIHVAANYRPISILNCLAKTLERIVHTTLYTAVKCTISDSQHGFVKKRSAISNLMDYTSMLIRKIEKGQQIDSVYFDFSKAFDKVPHELLIRKLERLGLPRWMTDWIRSYLTQRSAFVKIHNTSSTMFRIPSGVPQGSIIGPLLFILFVNDLCGLLSSDAHMYADDLKISRTIITPADCLAMQLDIDTLLEWCAFNGMEVNSSKCKVLSFFRTQTFVQHVYTMKAAPLERVSSIRDLGVIIDSKLRFNEHISAVSSKAFAMLGFIRRNTVDFDDVNALKALYCSLVRSVLEYAVQVWAPYHAIYSNRLESIQRRFVSFIFRGALRNDAIAPLGYIERCVHLNLQPLSTRRVLLQRLFIFDVLTNNIDCSNILAQVCFLVPARTLRSQQLLQIQRHRTEYGHNNPLTTCCRSFNVVSHVFDFNITKQTYKRNLHLLE